MYPVKRRIAGKQREFVVFTRAEADERGLKYVPWQEAKAGDLALSDDGYVSDCLKIQVWKDRVKKTFSFGQAWVTRSAKLLFEPHLVAGKYEGTSVKTWQEREAGKTRTKNMVTMYVRQFIANHGRVDFETLGKIYRPDQKIPAATVKRLLKQEKIKQMISDEMKTELEGSGFTKAKILKVFEKAIELAEETGNPAAMIRGAEELAKMQEMYPEKKGNNVSLEFGVTADLSKTLEAARKDLPDAQKAIDTGHIEITDSQPAERAV